MPAANSCRHWPQRLALTRAQLMPCAKPTPPDAVRPAIRGENYEHAVRHLQAHTVPLHQWPGGGRAGQTTAWQSSPWLTTDEFIAYTRRLLRTDATTVRDAVRALQPTTSGARCSPNYKYPPTVAPSTILRLRRCACLDTRAPKPAPSDPAISHLRSAVRWSASAARKHFSRRHMSGTAAPPPSPPCAMKTRPTAPAGRRCARPGRSRCGTYEIVPLTTAKALVEEGNAHHHCVGTYYDACRSGGTQILSLRAHGTPMVTAEILLDARISSIRVGQFKGLYDEVPGEPAVHQAMREFLHELRTGAHPLNRQLLRAYRQWADDQIYRWNTARTPTLAHARDAFPLYLALLPRRTPADFDRWCEQTGLRQGLGAALHLLNKKAAEPALSPTEFSKSSTASAARLAAAARTVPCGVTTNPRRPNMGWLYQRRPGRRSASPT